MPGYGYDDQGAYPPKPAGRSPLFIIFVGCGVLALLACVGSAVMLGLGWGTFSRFGVQSDLEEYRKKVRSSHLDPAVEDELARRIDKLSNSLEGKQPSMMKWVDHDDEFKKLLEDGTLHEKDVPAFEKELERVESEFGVASVGSGR